MRDKTVILDLWRMTQQHYRQVAANVDFKTYPDLGYAFGDAILSNLAAFFRHAMSNHPLELK